MSLQDAFTDWTVAASVGLAVLAFLCFVATSIRMRRWDERARIDLALGLYAARRRPVAKGDSPVAR